MCSFFPIAGGHCGFDSKDKTKSVEMIPLLSCNANISRHKSAFSITEIENEVELLLARASIFALPKMWKSGPYVRSMVLTWASAGSAVPLSVLYQ